MRPGLHFHHLFSVGISLIGLGLGWLRRWISALASASSSAEDEEEQDGDEMSETGPWQVRTTARI